MNAVSLGPFTLAHARLFALLGLAAVLLVSALLRRRDPGLGDWGMQAILVGGVAARLGYVLTHLEAYAAEPWSVLFFWQGGFALPWGVFAAALFALWRFRGTRERQVRAQIPLAAGLALWLLLTAAQDWMDAGSAPELPPEPLPTLAGGSRPLGGADGGPVVVNLWASWCPPCRREMPRLADAARAREEVAFAFVNQGEARRKVADFIGRFELAPRAVFLDHERRLAAHFGAAGLPATLFYNGRGKLVASHVGEISRAALQDQLDRITAP
ncbi:prolipoprotein diacylglyceryl transferase family protein [Thiohalorhabdus sp. Cl-TMA]|uniref:Prolipoprotein diacylglyceryl transferase family protein n=1 Tax=Thiohalorhabdus methylotrophus TaxID=3242694 RepID=A0ABV4TVQ9_9GAMM